MQSPKFKFLQEDLSDVFSTTLLKDEWRKRVRSQIRKQLIFDPIEYRDIDARISSMISGVRRDVLKGEYSVERPKRYLAEKSRGLCRQMTLIHPRDLLVLERLSRSMYFELKMKAPSSAAFFEPDDGSFTKGFLQSDFEYGSFASWKKFQKSVFGFAKENKYIIRTDVANFYDFINFQHLRNIVASLADIREAVLDLLIYVLNRLTWTPDFMPLTQVGMPQIETSATRVLANAMLYEVDRLCEHSAVSNYARFMDDMDIGVQSIPAAKAIIRDLDLTLQSRQLRLNSSKTQIMSQAEAFEHFCIAENSDLTRISIILKKKHFSSIVLMILKAKYEKWLERTAQGEPGPDSRFRKGNGTKIHKYVISLIYEAGGAVEEGDLLWLVRNDPAMRSTALRYLARSRRNNSNLASLVDAVSRQLFVDDAAYVDIANFLLHGRFRQTARCEKLARQFCQFAINRSDIGLHAAIFVAAKFLGRAEVIKIIGENLERISGDFWLSRAAAGVAPLFFREAEWADYRKLLSRLESEDAESVLDYLQKVMTAGRIDSSLKAYITARNHSFPQGLFFPKVLILLAISKNSAVSTLAPRLYADHPALRADRFYHRMGFS